jgi:transcriptional regulator with XRE-family HTH domain
MSIQDDLLHRFRAVVDAEIAAAGGKASDGYRAVAEKTHLGYDYIYQIHKGKPAHKPKRPSLDAMAAIERAYGTPESPSDKIAPSTKVTPMEALAVLQAEIEHQTRATISIHHLEHAWPFKTINRDEWEMLTDEQKAALETVARTMLATHSAGGGGQHDKRRAA